jgi:hypothetical protein
MLSKTHNFMLFPNSFKTKLLKKVLAKNVKILSFFCICTFFQDLFYKMFQSPISESVISINLAFFETIITFQFFVSTSLFKLRMQIREKGATLSIVLKGKTYFLLISIILRLIPTEIPWKYKTEANTLSHIFALRSLSSSSVTITWN